MLKKKQKLNFIIKMPLHSIRGLHKIKHMRCFSTLNISKPFQNYSNKKCFSFKLKKMKRK